MNEIRYVHIKRPDTDEIRNIVKLFCDETGADRGACQMILNRLSRMQVFGALNGSLQAVGGFYVLGDKAIFDFVYVQPEYRSRSIAGRLHRMAVDHVKKMGISKVLLFAKPERANGYMKRGYKLTMTVLEKEL